MGFQACTANCRGFDYWLGYYGAAEDYYQHGSRANLDFHENFEQAPQYRGEYSTTLFTRKAIEWATNVTGSDTGRAVGSGASAHDPTSQTLLYLAFQAVHGPIEAPPSPWANATGCDHIVQPVRKTYCEMMQALDASIGMLTAAYTQLGIFDDTVFLFLADNGGMNDEGGFNVPLRGGKATVWEGGLRSQTFLHWSGFQTSLKGSIYSGLAHAADWGVTLTSALGYVALNDTGVPPLDGMDLWPALTCGGASPRTEMLLSMRDAGQCPAGNEYNNCVYSGEFAYRRGAYKLIYGHPALRGVAGLGCDWTTKGLECWNGWGKPRDVGPSRPPPALPTQPGQSRHLDLGRAPYVLYGVNYIDLVSHQRSQHSQASKPHIRTLKHRPPFSKWRQASRF